MSQESRQRYEPHEEVKTSGSVYEDPAEILRKLRAAKRSRDEEFLSQMIETAKAMGEAFEWSEDLC